MELMKASKVGIDLIKKFEGCKLTAYKPVSTEKYYTIGYGHYGADVKKGMTITATKAEELLKKDIEPIEKALNALGINFKQNQFDSLVSWIFNLGLGSFNGSSLKKYIVAYKEDALIAEQITRWYYAGGQPLLGLKKRRVEEANMWLGKDVYYVDSLGNIKKR